MIRTIDASDCQHPRWCRAKRVGPHSAECPTNLRLSDGDVLAFAARFVHLDSNDVRVIARADYDGRRASTSLYVPPSTFDMYVGQFGDVCRVKNPMPALHELRWLAEELIQHEKMKTPRDP